MVWLSADRDASEFSQKCIEKDTKWITNIFSSVVFSLWHDLPNSMISAPSVSAFRGRLDNYWMDYCYTRFFCRK